MYSNSELFLFAIEQPKDVFLGNITLSVPDDMDGRVDFDSEKSRLSRIWDVAHMTIRDMVEESGLSQTTFAAHACIRLRTVQSWCLGERECPVYVRFLLAEHYHLI